MTKQEFKQKIKYWLPPIIFDKLQYLKAYKNFLQYKNLVTNNIELKDKHKGKRCFILGSGPSIKQEDLKPLKNEIVFALNNFYVHADFKTIMSGEVPKYYMTAPIHKPQTEKEWKDWFEDMEKFVPQSTTMLLGLNSYKENIKYIFDKYSVFQKHNINWYFAGVNINDFYQFNIKDIDVSNMIWSANTVSIYAIIMAIYMGFDEIYLLGMDHNYMCIQKENNYRFYQNAIHQRKEIERTNFSNTNEFLATGKALLLYEILYKNINTNIYNCSDNSLIDTFEYQNLKDILK